jgi:catechol 2,3-dioxygenase-like lactoylglutathione lyase family enzyme
MFDHVKFGVSDYAASKAFFLKALEPLGVAVVSEGPPGPDGQHRSGLPRARLGVVTRAANRTHRSRIECLRANRR